jgi:hypothetical protein
MLQSLTSILLAVTLGAHSVMGLALSTGERCASCGEVHGLPFLAVLEHDHGADRHTHEVVQWAALPADDDSESPRGDQVDDATHVHGCPCCPLRKCSFLKDESTPAQFQFVADGQNSSALVVEICRLDTPDRSRNRADSVAEIAPTSLRARAQLQVWLV